MKNYIWKLFLCVLFCIFLKPSWSVFWYDMIQIFGISIIISWMLNKKDRDLVAKNRNFFNRNVYQVVVRLLEVIGQNFLFTNEPLIYWDRKIRKSCVLDFYRWWEDDNYTLICLEEILSNDFQTSRKSRLELSQSLTQFKNELFIPFMRKFSLCKNMEDIQVCLWELGGGIDATICSLENNRIDRDGMKLITSSLREIIGKRFYNEFPINKISIKKHFQFIPELYTGEEIDLGCAIYNSL